MSQSQEAHRQKFSNSQVSPVDCWVQGRLGAACDACSLLLAMSCLFEAVDVLISLCSHYKDCMVKDMLCCQLLQWEPKVQSHYGKSLVAGLGGMKGKQMNTCWLTHLRCYCAAAQFGFILL